MSRTTRELPVPADPWPTIESWASTEGFRLVKGAGEHRTYQRGRGLIVAPMMCEFSSDGSNLRMESWIRVGLIMRIFALLMIPAEMQIESGGLKLAVPRRLARQRVNRLLAEFAQPEIP